MTGFGAWPLSAYDDVVKDVLAEWERAAARAIAIGLPRESLVMDPGIGSFTKASRHSFELLRRASEIVDAIATLGDVPRVLFGASNKSFLTLVDRGAQGAASGKPRAPQHRLGASLVAAVHAARSAPA